MVFIELFSWFAYTFVNYKYKVLLTRDNVCLIPMSAQFSFSTVPQHYDNVNNDFVTTLSQHHCVSWSMSQ